MKSAAISKTVFPRKASSENVATMRAELNAKILKLLSQPMVLDERVMLHSLLADPVALTRLVRHAGLSMALNKALEKEGTLRTHANNVQVALLPLELAHLLLKAKPIAFGSGESYGANLELGKSQPHGSSPAYIEPKIAVQQSDLGFGMATPYAPTSSDYDHTIDYLVDENREQFDAAFFATNRNGNASLPGMSTATSSILSVVGLVFLLMLGFIYAHL